MWSLNTIKHINLSSMFIFDSSHHIVYKLQIICIIFNLLSLSCHDHQLCWILGLCIDCFRNKIVIHPPTPPNEISLVHSHCFPNNTITMVNVFTIPADTHFIFNSLLIKQTPRCRWMCLHNTHHGFNYWLDSTPLGKLEVWGLIFRLTLMQVYAMQLFDQHRPIR